MGSTCLVDCTCKKHNPNRDIGGTVTIKEDGSFKLCPCGCGRNKLDKNGYARGHRLRVEGSPRKGSNLTDEQKSNISKGLLGHVVSQETKDKIRIANTGKHHLEETKEKLRVIPHRSGWSHTEEAKQKMSDKQKGKIVTQEFRDSVSRRFLGKKISIRSRMNRLGRKLSVVHRQGISRGLLRIDRSTSYANRRIKLRARLDEKRLERLLVFAYPEYTVRAQYVINTPTGRYRVDLAVPELGLVFEADGYYHDSLPQFIRDAKRQQTLEELGWVVTRFTGEELTRIARDVLGETP